MKKLLLLSFFLFSYAFSNAQLTSLSEGFENFPFPATGWNADYGAAPLWGRTNSGQHAGSFCAEVGMGVFDPIVASLETPQINISTSSVKQLSFWRKNVFELTGNKDSTFVQISTNTGSSWTTLKILKADALNDGVWQKEVIDLTSYASQTFSIRWKYVGEGMEAWQMQIDDINIGSVAPSSLMISSALNQASINLSWQHPGADSFNIYRSTDNTVYTAIGTSTTNTYIDNTISLNSRYYYKVKAVYNSVETSFSTSATVKVPGGQTVWLDDFESGTINPAYTLIDGDGVLAFDSMNYDNLSTAWQAYAWKIRSKNSTTTYACHSGNYSIGAGYNQDGSSNDDWIILPQISVTDTTFRFGFYSTSQDAAYKETLEVLVSTTTASPANFTAINTIAQVPGRPNWGEYEYSLKNYNGQSIFIAIRCTSPNKYIAIVDDIYVFKDLTTSINSAVKNKSDINIFPNPSNSSFNIEIIDKSFNSVQIYNMKGQLIDNFKIEESKYIYTKNLDNGIYMLRATNGTNIIQKKLIISK
ncbi:MAG: choice-of-anchor J domain-containing protein [Bacteroidota bacterium]